MKRAMRNVRRVMDKAIALRSLWTISLLVAQCSWLNAASAKSGSAFLRIDTTARAAALAGAYTASAGSLDILAYNPGGLAALDRSEVSFTHTEWLQGTNYDYLAYGQPTRLGTFAFSMTRLGYGDMEGRDALRQPTGTFDANDSAYALAYGNKIGTGLGVGAALKWIRRTIDTDHASGYAMDVGGVSRIPGRPIHLGISILNIGPDTRFIDQKDPLPLTLAMGAAYAPNRTLRLTGDLKHEPHDKRTTLMTGMEYAPVAAITLRGGYQVPVVSTGDEVWDMDNLRGGVGVTITRFQIDYALAPFGELGLTHRFTVGMSFGTSSSEPHILKSSNLLKELLPQIESTLAQVTP